MLQLSLSPAILFVHRAFHLYDLGGKKHVLYHYIFVVFKSSL